MRDREYTGGCLCGAVRFVATGQPLNPHACSCRMCQRHTGAFTVAWVEFPRDAVEWVGPGGPPSTYRSSDFSSRAFCSTCGSTIGALDDAPVVAFVLGCFDRPGSRELMPGAHSYRSARPRWWHVELGATAGKRRKPTG